MEIAATFSAWVRRFAWSATLFGLVLRLSNARMVFLGIGAPAEMGGGSYVPTPSDGLVSLLGWLTLLLLAATLAVEAKAAPVAFERIPARLWEGPRTTAATLLFAAAHLAFVAWFWGRWVLN